MSTIIAAHFQLQDDIEQARGALLGAGFRDHQLSAFFVNQPGQHDVMPHGGDHPQSPGAKETPAGVLEGGAGGGLLGVALGAATAPLTGAVGPIVGGLVGAHVGSLFSFSKMKDGGEAEAGDENLAEPRKPGMLMAVALDDPAQERRAIEVLRGLGADHLERAEGTIAQGDWVDFDPLSMPSLIA